MDSLSNAVRLVLLQAGQPLGVRDIYAALPKNRRDACTANDVSRAVAARRKAGEFAANKPKGKPHRYSINPDWTPPPLGAAAHRNRIRSSP